MKARNSVTSLVAAVAVASLTACASWTPEQRGTAVGAAAGGVVGNVVTGGGALGTIGGAAAGGLIGHEVGKRQSQ